MEGIVERVSVEDMAMTSLTITLSDDLAKIAEEQGLLTTAALEAYVLEKVRTNGKPTNYPSGFDVRLQGAAAPELMGSVKYHGDIVGPFFEEWGETP